LSTAKDLLTQADSLFAETGEKRATSVALEHWGNILTAENDLAHARQKYEQSLTTLAQSGQKDFLQECRMSLAKLNIEEGRTGKAETLLRQVIEDFRAQKNEGGEAWALAIDARARLEAGDIPAALKSAKMAQDLSTRNHSLNRNLDTRLIVARLQGLTGDRRAAEKELKSLLAEAERRGDVPLGFNVRLSLGEIALKSHDALGRKILTDLARDAASKGFLLISQKALRTRTGSLSTGLPNSSLVQYP
jgi:hypothetical protein